MLLDHKGWVPGLWHITINMIKPWSQRKKLEFYVKSVKWSGSKEKDWDCENSLFE